MPDAAGPGIPGPVGRARHAAPDGGPARARVRTGRRARHRDRSGRLRPLLLGGLLALVLAAVVGTAGLLARPSADDGVATPPPPPAADPAPPSPTGPPPAEWLPAALAPSAGLAASADVREELAAAGVPADRLRPAEDEVRPGDLLAVTGTPPPGARVVARLGRADGGGELLVVDPRPGEPTAEQREARRSLGAALLANPTTTTDPAVAAALGSGEVDPRVLGLLAALAAREGVGVAGLPVLPGEEDAPTPARWVLVDAVGGAPVPGDPAATERLRTWLAAQLPPYAPGVVEVTDGGVLVGFPYSSDPDALVADAAR